VKYRITYVESEEGVAVWCDDLPGCCSQGATKQEAEENIRVAIQEYLEVQRDYEETSGAKVSREEILI